MKRRKKFDNDISIIDPSRIEIRGNLKYGSNVEIDVNVLFQGDVTLGDFVKVRANCIISNSSIANNSIIEPFTIIEDSSIGENSLIGPYGRIRPKTNLGKNSKIGNFVEIKKSNIDCCCQINHLSFIGDSEIGRNVTIGAGVITCNHNSAEINQTNIKKGTFIGSGVTLIAPIKLQANSMVGAGSTIVNEVPKNALVISRAKQASKKYSNSKNKSKKISKYE